jgi:hypothetical protein
MLRQVSNFPISDSFFNPLMISQNIFSFIDAKNTSVEVLFNLLIWILLIIILSYFN